MKRARNYNEVIASYPPERRAEIEARAKELLEEVKALKAVREIAQRTQEKMAASLNIKQPAVAKIERQTDLHLSTLRRFVEAAGGELELRVTLPGHAPVRVGGLGELSEA